MPKDSGKATRNTTSDAGTSYRRTVEDSPPNGIRTERVSTGGATGGFAISDMWPRLWTIYARAKDGRHSHRKPIPNPAISEM